MSPLVAGPLAFIAFVALASIAVAGCFWAVALLLHFGQGKSGVTALLVSLGSLAGLVAIPFSVRAVWQFVDGPLIEYLVGDR